MCNHIKKNLELRHLRRGADVEAALIKLVVQETPNNTTISNAVCSAEIIRLEFICKKRRRKNNKT